MAVVAVLVLIALVRLRVADVPLERDEGEYAYAGQLILQGIPPYQLAYNMKFPGTYPLMEPQRYAAQMQTEMMREIDAAHPTYLVLGGVDTSWLARPLSDRRIVDWAERYARTCYDLAGIADIHSMRTTTVHWDGEASGYTPRSTYVVSTYRRKSEAPCAVAR